MSFEAKEFNLMQKLLMRAKTYSAINDILIGCMKLTYNLVKRSKKKLNAREEIQQLVLLPNAITTMLQPPLLRHPGTVATV